MTRFARSVAATVLGLLFAGAAMADTLELKDGRVITGRFLGGTQALVRFSINGEVQTFNVTEVVALTFTPDYGTPPPPPPAPYPRLPWRLRRPLLRTRVVRSRSPPGRAY